MPVREKKCSDCFISHTSSSSSSASRLFLTVRILWIKVVLPCCCRSNRLSSLLVRIAMMMTMFLQLITPTEQYYGFNGGSLARTIQTLEQYACEGSTMIITCPLTTVISVQYAKFGRSVPNSEMCSPKVVPDAAPSPAERVFFISGSSTNVVRSLSSGEDTNCLAIRSLEVLLDLCEDRPQCRVLAESSTFQQDPCPTTSKYLEVHYKCRPNEFEQLTVCEGEQLEISCPKALRIAVYSAMFGRAPNGTSLCPANRPGYIDCQSSDTVSEVRTICQGRKRCDLNAAESVFGNPCASGINKYLTVTYACVPKRILKELRRHKGRSGHKHKNKIKSKAEETKLATEDDGTGQSLIAGQSTEVHETYINTETLEIASADSAAGFDKQYSVRVRITSTPASLSKVTSQVPRPDGTDKRLRPIDSDTHSNRVRSMQSKPKTEAATHQPTENKPRTNVIVSEHSSNVGSDLDVYWKEDRADLDSVGPKQQLPGQAMEDTEDLKTGEIAGVESVTDSNLTILCINFTMSTVRTLPAMPTSSELPMGFIKEWFSTLKFIQNHQETAILYFVLGICVGMIMLLVIILGRACYQLKRKSRAKLDLTEPTHSRNISHNHSSLETPMLEHSDSIDRIEVVRFQPRGTMRSGYHSALQSDIGDRSLNNYYG